MSKRSREHAEPVVPLPILPREVWLLITEHLLCDAVTLHHFLCTHRGALSLMRRQLEEWLYRGFAANEGKLPRWMRRAYNGTAIAVRHTMTLLREIVRGCPLASLRELCYMVFILVLESRDPGLDARCVSGRGHMTIGFTHAPVSQVLYYCAESRSVQPLASRAGLCALPDKIVCSAWQIDNKSGRWAVSYTPQMLEHHVPLSRDTKLCRVLLNESPLCSQSCFSALDELYWFPDGMCSEQDVVKLRARLERDRDIRARLLALMPILPI